MEISYLVQLTRDGVCVRGRYVLYKDIYRSANGMGTSRNIILPTVQKSLTNGKRNNMDTGFMVYSLGRVWERGILPI